jgi:hypothetical protein
MVNYTDIPCLESGRAVVVAYSIYRGRHKEYGMIPGVLGPSEAGLGTVEFEAGLQPDRLAGRVAHAMRIWKTMRGKEAERQAASPAGDGVASCRKGRLYTKFRNNVFFLLEVRLDAKSQKSVFLLCGGPAMPESRNRFSFLRGPTGVVLHEIRTATMSVQKVGNGPEIASVGQAIVARILPDSSIRSKTF